MRRMDRPDRDSPPLRGGTTGAKSPILWAMTTTLGTSGYIGASASASLAGMNPAFEMRRVANRDDWARVRSLRYEALRSRDDIAEDADGAYADSHDIALNTSTFLLARNGRPVGTTRASVSSAARRWALPAMEAFGREIEASVGLESTIVEASLMLVDPATSADPKTVLFHLFKAHMLQCAAENADWLLVGVRDSQIGFYRRMFNMEILSGAEKYPGIASPRVLMGLEYREQAALLFKRIPVLAVTGADEMEFAASGGVSFPGERRALRQEAA
jgi:hypothetical protein